MSRHRYDAGHHVTHSSTTPAPAKCPGGQGLCRSTSMAGHLARAAFTCPKHRPSMSLVSKYRATRGRHVGTPASRLGRGRARCEFAKAVARTLRK